MLFFCDWAWLWCHFAVYITKLPRFWPVQYDTCTWVFIFSVAGEGSSQQSGFIVEDTGNVPSMWWILGGETYFGFWSRTSSCWTISVGLFTCSFPCPLTVLFFCFFILGPRFFNFFFTPPPPPPPPPPRIIFVTEVRCLCWYHHTCILILIRSVFKCSFWSVLCIELIKSRYTVVLFLCVGVILIESGVKM